MLKIKIAACFVSIVALIAIIATGCIGGTLACLVYFQIAQLFVAGKLSFDKVGWFTLSGEWVFLIGFFAVVYLWGSSRFGDVFYHIDAWVELHKPHLIKWYHNGVIGVVRKIDFDRGKDIEVGVSGMATRRVKNVMTFTYDSFSRREFTGSVNDLEQLEKGCVKDWRPIFVPNTSHSNEISVISLDEAYELVHGRTRK